MRINFKKLVAVLNQTSGDREKAAKVLGCTVNALNQRIRKGRIEHGLKFPDSPTPPSKNQTLASQIHVDSWASTHQGELVVVVEMLAGERCLVRHENGDTQSVSIFRLTPEPSLEEIEAAKKRLAEEAEARRSVERANYEKGESEIRVVDVRTLGEAAAAMVD